MFIISDRQWCSALALSKEEIRKRILECLKTAYPKDLFIKEIAMHVGLDRNTVSKHLDVLCAQGVICESRAAGRARLFTIPPSRKVQVLMLRDYLQYRRERVYQIAEDEAHSLIGCGIAKLLQGKPPENGRMLNPTLDPTSSQ
jgi:predicted transcriptional regulator with HTH domain